MIPAWRLAALYFSHAFVSGMLTPPLARILESHGYGGTLPYVFATSSVAAMISPVFVGVLADRGLSANWLLAGLAAVYGLLLQTIAFSVQSQWPAGLVVTLFMVQALFSVPIWSLISSLIFSQVCNAEQEFPLIRLWATIGWMMAGAFVSYGLRGDQSVSTLHIGGLILLGQAVYCRFALPQIGGNVLNLNSSAHWTTWLGREAWALLRNHDHRVVFVTAGLFSIPLAAYYQYTSIYLKHFGNETPSATLAWGQLPEILCLLLMPVLLKKVRLKWLLMFAISAGMARYALYALGESPPRQELVMSGIVFHGFIVICYFVTTSLYIEQRFPKTMRSQAQGLAAFFISGIGPFVGAFASGWWYHYCMKYLPQHPWGWFWGGLAGFNGLVLIYFGVSYRGQEKAAAGKEDVSRAEAVEGQV